MVRLALPLEGDLPLVVENLLSEGLEETVR